MKPMRQDHKSSLFLLEMIFSILVLALCSAACIRLFAVSWQNRREARAWNHIQELTINFSEILEAGDGSMDSFLTFYPEGERSSKSLLYYYDLSFQPAQDTDAVYQLEVSPSLSQGEKSITLRFLQAPDTLLYEKEIRYPVFSSEEEEEVQHAKTD